MEGMSMPREFREIEGLMRTQLHCLILPKLRTLTRFSFRRDCLPALASCSGPAAT